MAARALAWLGIPMGVPVPAPLELVNYEDPEFVTVLHLSPPARVDVDRLGALVERRNQSHAVWGFKVPTAIYSLAVLAASLRQPHFVLVFRDIFATALRDTLAMDSDLLERMRFSASLYQEMLQFLENTSAACMLVSYEKALEKPRLFCSELARFAGVAVSAEVLEAAAAQIAPNHPEYLRRVGDARTELGLPR